MYAWGSMDTLSYSMTRRYMSDIDFLFTQRRSDLTKAGRLYLDISWTANKEIILLLIVGEQLIQTIMRVWNDQF